jgi:hypothetical protein
VLVTDQHQKQLKRSPRPHRTSISRNNIVCAIVLINFGKSYAALHRFDDAWRCIGERSRLSKHQERWFEAEVHRIAGEIALKSIAPDRKSRSVFRPRAAVARAQQQILGTTRRTSMASLARSGQAG